MPTWLAGQVPLPALVGQLAGVAEARIVQLAHHVVVGGGVHVADDQVGVLGPPPPSRITSWSRRQAGW